MTNRFGLYVHVPYCVHRCSYCDFFSSAKYEASDFDRVGAALLRELSDAGGYLERRGYVPSRLESLFFGGGTPSLMPSQGLERIIDDSRSRFGLDSKTEVTLEANPETVTLEKVREWREIGINRVSLGVQTLNLERLKLLERLATPDSVARAVTLLKEGGLDNFSLDFIFAIPGQDVDSMRDDLRRGIEFGPKHISFYNLTLKPGHPLYRALPSEDSAADLYEAGIRYLADAGYAQYEISNFSQPGRQSLHNLLYWSGGDFLGVGPSASSRFFWDGRFHHRKQVSDLESYFREPSFPGPGFESADEKQTLLEAAFLELRKNSGIVMNDFENRYRYRFSSAPKFSLFLREGLIATEGDRLFLTAKGRMLADSVTRDLVP